MILRLKEAAIWLSLIFVLSTAANLALLAIRAGQMSDTDSKTLFETILKIHAVPLGALFPVVFARKGKRVQIGISTLWIAVFVSFLWGCIVTYSWVGFPSSLQAPDVNARYLAYSTDSAWLLVAMLATFTGKTDHD